MIRKLALFFTSLVLALAPVADASTIITRGAASARGFGLFGAGAFDTFDLSVSGSNLSLSANKLTATKITANAYSTAQSAGFKTAGKWYLEFVFVDGGTGGDVGVGVTRVGWNTATGNFPGNVASSVGVRCNGSGLNDNVSWTGGNAPDLACTPSGTHMFVAIDAGNSLVWFKKEGGTNWNNSGTANPATGVGGLTLSGSGGIRFAAAQFAATNNDSSTVNTGQTAFVGTPPSGFAPWH